MGGSAADFEGNDPQPIGLVFRDRALTDHARARDAGVRNLEPHNHLR